MIKRAATEIAVWLCLFAAIIALAACGQERPRIALPPAEYLTCADEPPAPSIPARDGTDATQLVRDQMALAYILAMRSAFGSCKAAVAGVNAWARQVD